MRAASATPPHIHTVIPKKKNNGAIDTRSTPISETSVDVLEHLIGGLRHLRVRLVRPLRQDHLNKFLDYVHVRLFLVSLLKGAQPSLPPGVPNTASPEAVVGRNMFEPTLFKPPGFANIANCMVPTCCAAVCPGCVMLTVPSLRSSRSWQSSEW